MTIREDFDSAWFAEGLTGCWLWLRATTKDGYGKFKLPGRQLEMAHRWSWIRAHGSIPPGLFVCHRCDNPGCCNPDHLFLGTNRDNMNDMVAKGRFNPGDRSNAPKGEGCPASKLTWETVRQIRRLVRDGQRPVDVSRALGVPIKNLRMIVSGRTWKESGLVLAKVPVGRR